MESAASFRSTTQLEVHFAVMHKLREKLPSRVFKCQIWVSLTCIDLGGGQQQREAPPLSDANSTIGKFLQAATHAKMHVQVHLTGAAPAKKIHLFLCWTVN